MSTQLKKIILILSVTIAFVALLVIVNQIVQLSQSIGYLNPVAGRVFLVLAFSFVFGGLLTPVFLYMRLPGPLIPPSLSASEKEKQLYMQRLRSRLSHNKRLVQPVVLSSEQDIEAAIGKLNQISEDYIRQTAKRAFYTTAISQNGALDALFMLGLQFKLIWDVAHVYSQRPTLRDMGFLYSNVMVTAFIAAQLDEAEYLEILETAINTGIGSAISLVPGTTLIVNSAMSGASNAFLTLRVGMIARGYCSARIRPERKTLRNAATTQAVKFLGSIVATGTTDLVKHIGTAPFKKWFGMGKKKDVAEKG
jgi:hypothetical protein